MAERVLSSPGAEILEGVRPGGTAVLNADDVRLRRVGEAWDGRVVWFGRDRRHDVSAERWRGTVFGMRFDLRVGGTSVEVALPLAGVLLNGLLGRRLGRGFVNIVGPGVVALAFIVGLFSALDLLAFPVRDREVVVALWKWITIPGPAHQSLGVGMSFCLY